MAGAVLTAENSITCPSRSTCRVSRAVLGTQPGLTLVLITTCRTGISIHALLESPTRPSDLPRQPSQPAAERDQAWAPCGPRSAPARPVSTGWAPEHQPAARAWVQGAPAPAGGRLQSLRTTEATQSCPAYGAQASDLVFLFSRRGETLCCHLSQQTAASSRYRISVTWMLLQAEL